jgi:hypothetical protein
MAEGGFDYQTQDYPSWGTPQPLASSEPAPGWKPTVLQSGTAPGTTPGTPPGTVYDIYGGYIPDPNINPNPVTYDLNTGQPKLTQQNYQNAYNAYSSNQSDQAREGGITPPDPNDPWLKMRSMAYDKAQVLPGVRPNIGFVPGMGGINLQSFNPFGEGQVDPTEQRLVDMASQRGLNTPTFKSLGPQGFQNLRSGYEYLGSPSPREKELNDAFLRGEPINMDELFQLRSKRIGIHQKSDFQKAMQGLSMAVGAGIFGLTAAPLAPVIGSLAAGTVGGAIGGGVTSTVASHGDPKASLTGLGLGALGGAAGGGASSLASSLGAGPLGSAAIGGAVGGAASGAAGGLAKGNFDWRNVAIGAGAGAAGSAAGYGVGQIGSTPGYAGEHYGTPPTLNPYAGFASRFAAPVAGSVTGGTLSHLWKEQQRKKKRINPYA